MSMIFDECPMQNATAGRLPAISCASSSHLLAQVSKENQENATGPNKPREKQGDTKRTAQAQEGVNAPIHTWTRLVIFFVALIKN